MTDNQTFEVEEFAAIGRTFSEYKQIFDLDPATIDRPVLDCPSGVGSFVAQAADRGIHVVGADILYGHSPERLARRCKEDYASVANQLPEKADLFNWEFYGSIENRQRLLLEAYEAFLDDFTAGCRKGRYVHAALPRLPFRANAFPIVLSAHLLFLYGDRLDFEFHLASLRELARVAESEVRVFPLLELDTSTYRHLDRIIDRLRDDGFTVERRVVPFEFQRGANEMLVLSDVA